MEASLSFRLDYLMRVDQTAGSRVQSLQTVFTNDNILIFADPRAQIVTVAVPRSQSSDFSTVEPVNITDTLAILGTPFVLPTRMFFFEGKHD